MPLPSVESLPSLLDAVAMDRYVLSADGSELIGRNPPLSLGFRADGEGIRFDGWSLRTAAWGRSGSLEDARTAPVSLAACLASGEAGASAGCLRPAVWTRGDLVETWANRPGGLEQAWEVRVRPPGAGPLLIGVEVEGAVLFDGDDDVAWLSLPDGRVFEYGGVYAWDATGRPLPAGLSVAGDRLWIRVEDAGAAWPVTVDPMLSTPVWTCSGTVDYEYAGVRVSGAGDVNGDGYDDVVVGAPGAGDGEVDEGLVYLFEGSSAGLPTTASWVFQNDLATTNAGYALDGAGDVDGDGYDDIVVGAPDRDTGEDGGWADEGYAYLLRGSAGAPVADWTRSGPSWFASFVSGAGDVDGDGYDDVLVDTISEMSLYHGSASGLAATAAWTGSGSRAAAAGDVNGDGYDDVLLSIPGWTRGGLAELYEGGPDGLADRASWSVASDDIWFGEGLAGAGDVNADGYDDILLSAPRLSGTAGVVYLYYGSRTGPASVPDWSVEDPGADPARDEGFGWSVAGAGDLNADGYADIAAGSPRFSSGGIGGVLVYLGSSAGPATTPDWEHRGTGVGEGYSVDGAGDIDGDGLDEIIVGDPWRSDGASLAGGAMVFAWDDTPDGDGDGDGDPASTDCDDADASVHAGAAETCNSRDDDCDRVVDEGVTTAWYADADGDGYGDPDTSELACAAIAGSVTDATDCDDTAAAVNPAAAEVCDPADMDEDCDGLADDDDPSLADGSAATSYADLDGDGYGDPGASIMACDAQPDASDCDDGSADVHPDAVDVPGDGVDQDCDGADAGDKATAEDPCGCASSSGGAGGSVAAGLLLLGARRRPARGARCCVRTAPPLRAAPRA